MHYIEIESLTFYHDDKPVSEDISYYINPGEFAILTGEDGAVKSTLIESTLGLLKSTSDKITVAKKNNAGGKVSTGYIPQQVASSDTGSPSTVTELICSGRFPRNRWFRPSTEKDYLHVGKALRPVDVWEMHHKRIGRLSGGQKQRISLARVSVTDPDLSILDEPTTDMNEWSRNEFYQLLQHSTHERGRAVLMIVHSYGDIKTYVDHQIHLVRKEGSK